MNVLIKFTTIGIDAGPFDLYSDAGVPGSAFEVGVTRQQLLDGFPSNNVPNGTNYITAISTGVCTNQVTLFVPGGITSTTTTTSTTIICGLSYSYNVDIYNCTDCSLIFSSITFDNTSPLTIGKYYINAEGVIVHILSFLGCGIRSSEFIIDANGKDTCAELLC